MELRVNVSKTAGSGQSGVQARIFRCPEYPGSKPGLTGPGAQNPISAKNWDFSKDFEMNWIYRFLLDPRGECPRGNSKNPSTFEIGRVWSSKYLETVKNARELQIQRFSGVSRVERILPSRFDENLMVGRMKSPLWRIWVEGGGVRGKRKWITVETRPPHGIYT